MIEIQNFTKRYGKKVAVDDLTCTVKPGQVTGFLGPNGAGKSTTMRSIIGLDTPTSGQITVNGQDYRKLAAPISEVGALLDAKSAHPGRSAFNHLTAIARTHGIGRQRVEEVIDLVGLSQVAKKKAGAFSLGMGQRLGIAVALLGNPQTLILDEPVNGLDPDGVKWMRNLLRRLADEGRTVFLSSHLMSELSLIADHIIVIGQGKLLADSSMSEFINRGSSNTVRVVSPDAAALKGSLQGPDVTISESDANTLSITGIEPEVVGRAAAAGGYVLHELTTEKSSLEDVFMDLTAGAVEYRPTEAKQGA
ncbi:ATP-binding cassette domain-containing protein [Haloglycomyces albus]|uniref:ATP-binding cassette domain-containing protein n=1 Tax=Haloglycomyces albus TaxID=526067 RepID=UPI00046D1115|nr:ATP-binding cassette domain-containing protein [Haloglycomyces albus]